MGHIYHGVCQACLFGHGTCCAPLTHAIYYGCSLIDDGNTEISVSGSDTEPICEAGASVPNFEDDYFVAWTNVEMAALQRLAAEIARTDIPVLILGESGTGKEVLATQIHAFSKDRALAFVKLSCTAYGTDSFQAQLKKLESGWRAKNGNRAGTVFFDEVGELDVDLQRRVLHLFPERNAMKGSPQFGRIISCTSQDLELDLRTGRFRGELFYRLQGVCLKLPPLRQLREDIPGLAQFFARKYSRIFRRHATKLSDRALSVFAQHAWPGNVRELENVVRKIVALENEEPALSDLAPQVVPLPPISKVTGSRSLKAVSRAASRQAERELILQALSQTHWNRKRAAEALQISYKSLLYKLKQIEFLDS